MNAEFVIIGSSVLAVLSALGVTIRAVRTEKREVRLPYAPPTLAPDDPTEIDERRPLPPRRRAAPRTIPQISIVPPAEYAQLLMRLADVVEAKRIRREDELVEFIIMQRDCWPDPITTIPDREPIIDPALARLRESFSKRQWHNAASAFGAYRRHVDVYTLTKFVIDRERPRP